MMVQDPQQRHLPLVVVEDSDEDFDALRWALKKVGVQRPVHRCANATELFEYLRAMGAHRPAVPATAGEGLDAVHPALILLDLNLGADSGHDVLATLKADPVHRAIPVVVWTSSNHPEDVARSYASGASGYATKPAAVEQLVSALRTFADYWFGTMVLPGAGARG